MSVNNYSTDLLVVNINGRLIDDWGETATPLTIEPIDQKSQLRRGQGGNAVRLDRINPGMRVTINLNPGSPDSAFVNGLLESRATVAIGIQQVGTLEVHTGVEGVIINRGQIGRGGSTITDDQYVIEFNTWTSLMGGE